MDSSQAVNNGREHIFFHIFRNIISGPNVSAQSSFSSNDFSNNSFTDLVPLIPLFGEDVTEQFKGK
jgi:hypothetical protein